ncbi:DUF885 domain-containing protein [Sphingosinicella sp. LHD-64]|uniref:DUF885 domain-containing protein n=1 Tax=Sphingosinicella sp. LHD-64 TaxID=3072139 RepID=UPI0028108296|nr:DUF885 domain-containing protein [Sphingosinicella sp. LHD-64]MDQ8756875.1 DUF885 domain-containing protein [Sphingosinicella sp. LHD-64]
MTRRAALLAAACLAVVPALSATAQTAPPAAAQASESAGERLRRLFHESDEANLRRNPLSALFRGDMRYADQLGDYLTDAHDAAEKGAAEQDLAALAAIDRNMLSPTDQLAYDVFQHQRREDLADYEPDMLALTRVRPINHFFGFHTFYPTFASGQGAAPFRTVQDYDNNVRRHHQYARLIDRAIGRFREGLASGVVETKLTIRNVVDQLDTQLRETPEQSPLLGPARTFADSIPEADRARLRTELLAVVRDEIYPAHQRLRDFLHNEYLPRARDQVGLSSMRGGDRLYARLVEENTTLPLTADAVHNIGLGEVARIRGEMDAIRRRTNFSGDLPAFFEFIRTDRRFEPQSREWLREHYYEIGRRVDGRIREIFSTIPRAPLEIREVEAFRERTEAGGSYQDGTPDGARPGIFYYNAYDLPSRRTSGMETLYLHEGSPGHHFQIMLAAENEALPNFMRFGGNTAFVEGWALYAETLWDELGVETDPYQRFGGLNDEMLRAMRLVVDTGIHSKGWTRDQAIQYMLSNSGMSRTEVVAEVERYIAIPGQALAYKIGQMKILELRARAEQALGPRFDLKDFHAQVLMTGALPLPVLERKIDDWIAARRAS